VKWPAWAPPEMSYGACAPRAGVSQQQYYAVPCQLCMYIVRALYCLCAQLCRSTASPDWACARAGFVDTSSALTPWKTL